MSRMLHQPAAGSPRSSLSSSGLSWLRQRNPVALVAAAALLATAAPVQGPVDRPVDVLVREVQPASQLAERLVAAVGAGERHETRERDYRYRVFLPRSTWADYVARAAQGIDYANFKEAVAQAQDRQRARDYAAVWGVMYHVQTRQP